MCANGGFDWKFQPFEVRRLKNGMKRLRVGEQLLIVIGKFPQLGKSIGGSDFVVAELVRECVGGKFVRIFRGLHVSEACQRETTVENLFVVRDEQAAFAGGHAFVLVEGECGAVAERSGLLAFVEGVVGLRGIFDDLEIVLLGDFADGIHVAAETMEMDAENGFCSRCDSGFDFGGVDQEGFRIDIDEDRNGHVVDDARRTGRPCVGSDDDLVACADATTRYAHMEGGAAAVCEIGVFIAVESAEFLFKKFRVFAAALGRFVKCRDDKIFVRFVDGWPVFDFSWLDDGFAAFDCKLCHSSG